ncbi:MAG: glycosyltransferase [Anaerolineales bacterium]
MVRTACREADLIIHSFLLTSTGFEIAQELGIPDMSAQFFPVFTSTAAFPAPTFPDLPLGDFYRRLTHQLVTGIFWSGSRLLYRRVQIKNPDLPNLTTWPFNPNNARQTPILYAFSPQVVPRPGDWGKSVSITGYWFLDDQENWSPDQELINFLGEGDLPIIVAFGSSSSLDMDRLYQKIIKALNLSNQRGILVGANPDLPGISPTVFRVNNVPYQWLFKRCAAVIHHGGAGTTGQGLAAGVPNIVLPFTSDQPFWARRVFKLGAGPKPLSPRRFTSQQLAQEIETAINDPHLKKTVQKIGAAIRKEDGAAQAVNLIQGLMDLNT